MSEEDAKKNRKNFEEIAKNQPSFKDSSPETKAKENDLVILDYNATVDGKQFKGGEGKILN